MTTESKKLQTTYTGHGSLGNLTDSAVVHDLFIAHEQREIIKRLIAAIGDEEAEEKAIAAAAPYLQD